MTAASTRDHLATAAEEYGVREQRAGLPHAVDAVCRPGVSFRFARAVLAHETLGESGGTRYPGQTSPGRATAAWFDACRWWGMEPTAERLFHWRGYLRLAQNRPGVTGSSCNPNALDVAIAWAAGMPLWAWTAVRDDDGALVALGAIVYATTSTGGRIGPQRARVMLRLARKRWLPQASRGQYAVSTADLRRLSRLSGAYLRWSSASDLPTAHTDGGRPRIDWAGMHDSLEEWREIDRHTWRSCGIDANGWGRWTADMPSGSYSIAREWVSRGWVAESRDARLAADVVSTEAAERLVKWAHASDVLPLLGKLRPDLMEPCIKAAADAASLGAIPETGDQLQEALESLGYATAQQHASDPGDAPAGDPRERIRARQGASRALDRLAQRSPDWAIRQYHWEYDRGRRIAPIMHAAVRDVVQALDDSPDVSMLIHGRDGELIYQLLRRLPSWRQYRRRVRYAITSRPLTVHGVGDEEYLSYLERLLPRDVPAIHVDTGFAGSIPRWMAGKGWMVERMLLISADDPGAQMPSLVEHCGLRNAVLEDIEHASHRMSLVSSSHKWGDYGMPYDPLAPGFWARLYGVCDALSMPRREVQA